MSQNKVINRIEEASERSAQDLPGNARIDDDIDQMDMESDVDEAAGRANMSKYTTSQPKEQPKQVPKPAESAQSPNSQQVDDSIEGYSQVTGYAVGSAAKIAAGDSYYRELQGFVDSTLRTLASRIAEKKSIELDTSAIKANITKQKEEIKKEELNQKAILKSIALELEQGKKKEKEIEELTVLLRMLVEKVAGREVGTDSKKDELELVHQQSQESLALAREKFQTIKQQLDEGRESAKVDIMKLEEAHEEASDMLDTLKKKVTQAKAIEYERTKMLREKSRILASLIGKENSHGKTALHQDIYKILKSPEKMSRMMSQTLSKSSKG